IDQGIQDLAKLGATIVDPGEHGALFQSCVDKYSSEWRNRLLVSQFPTFFPAGSDQIPTLVNWFLNPSLDPHTSSGPPSFRKIGPSAGDTGGAKCNYDWYLHRRGDAGMKTLGDLATKSNFYIDPVNGYPTKQTGLMSSNADLTYSPDTASQNRLAVQTMVFN